MKKIGMLTDLVRSIFHEPVTECYPIEKRPPVEAFRGMLHWDPALCTGCSLCVKDCPANAIELITIDKEAKHFVFRVHVDRCTFCGQCAYSCRFGSIHMNNAEWELAELGREDFTVLYGRPEDLEQIERPTNAERVVEFA